MAVRNVAMFEVNQAPPVRLSRMHEPLKAERGSYGKYAPKTRMQCDECVAVMHEERGQGPAIRSARQSRRTPTRTLRLCHGHAELWRALDGVGKP